MESLCIHIKFKLLLSCLGFLGWLIIFIQQFNTSASSTLLTDRICVYQWMFFFYIYSFLLKIKTFFNSSGLPVLRNLLPTG